MRYLLLALFVSCLLVGCAPSTKLTASWKREEAKAKSYEKLSVAVLLPKMSNRAIIESAVANALRAKGIKAKATFDIFPLAGKSSIVKDMELSPEELKAMVREKVALHEIDGLLVISLFDTQKEERYVEGANFGISAVYPYPYSATGGYSYPLYGYSYVDYYHYAYTTISESGYWETTTTYFLESNFYDIASEKLIWTGQSSSKDPKSVEKEADVYGDLLATELVSQNVVKP